MLPPMRTLTRRPPPFIVTSMVPDDVCSPETRTPGENLAPVARPGRIDGRAREPRQLATRGEGDRRRGRVEVAEVGRTGDEVDAVRAHRERDRLEDARPQRVGQHREPRLLRRVA